MFFALSFSLRFGSVGQWVTSTCRSVFLSYIGQCLVIMLHVRETGVQHTKRIRVTFYHVNTILLIFSVDPTRKNCSRKECKLQYIFKISECNLSEPGIR